MATGVVSTLTWGDLEPIRTAANAPATGLTWAATATLVNDGTTTTTLDMIEIGSTGRYRPRFLPPAVGVWSLEYNAVVDGVTAYFGQSVQIDPAIDTALVAAITAALSGVSVTVTSPVASNGDVEIVQGDDYFNADSRALAWATTSAGQWPDLTGASIAFKATHPTDRSKTLVTAGSVTTPTGASKAVRVELTKTQTAALLTPTEGYPFQVVATLGNGDVATLVDAVMTVLPRRG